MKNFVLIDIWAHELLPGDALSGMGPVTVSPCGDDERVLATSPTGTTRHRPSLSLRVWRAQPVGDAGLAREVARLIGEGIDGPAPELVGRVIAAVRAHDAARGGGGS